jgi:hypothetical protein
MLAGRFVPEKIIKRRDPRDLGRGNLRNFTDSFQTGLGQIAVLALNGLKDTKHSILGPAELFDTAINKCQINLVHLGAPMA